MNLLTKILSAKANIIATILIAVGSSLLTAFTIDGRFHGNREPVEQLAVPSTSTASVLECGQDVYSPVQRKCVSKQIFDEEMKRLFAALGIDASIYSPDTENN